jgi:adenylate kinase family enzyme
MGAPVIHLDCLYWGPGWSKIGPDNFRKNVVSALSGDRWVCERNYHRQTFDIRLPRSDLIIWLNTPTTLCLFRAIKRSLLACSRADLPLGCDEKLDAEFMAFLNYIRRFNRDVRPAIEAERLATGPHVPVLNALGNELGV